MIKFNTNTINKTELAQIVDELILSNNLNYNTLKQCYEQAINNGNLKTRTAFKDAFGALFGEKLNMTTMLRHAKAVFMLDEVKNNKKIIDTVTKMAPNNYEAINVLTQQGLNFEALNCVLSKTDTQNTIIKSTFIDAYKISVDEAVELLKTKIVNNCYDYYIPNFVMVLDSRGIFDTVIERVVSYHDENFKAEDVKKFAHVIGRSTFCKYAGRQNIAQKYVACVMLSKNKNKMLKHIDFNDVFNKQLKIAFNA